MTENFKFKLKEPTPVSRQNSSRYVTKNITMRLLFTEDAS